ncbi:beta-glucan synthesis-associated [Morchella snyderi]|nr:beta-glucan synthesis-associated [Morchella snyderi]
MSSIQTVGDYSRYPQWSQREASSSEISSALPALTISSDYKEGQLDDKSIFHEEDPGRGFSLYPEQYGGISLQYPTIDESEDDDIVHSPDSNEKIRPSYKRILMVVLYSTIFICGVCSLFIVWPVLTYARLAREGKSGSGGEGQLSAITYPLLGAARALIDADTPKYAMTRDSVMGGGKLKLVFSDEFNKDGRSFDENEDPFWQAMDFHYASTNDLEWYDPDAVTTKDGTLRLRLDAFKNHNLNYRSGMLQSWNKLCFKGGVFEASVSLPGPAGVPGLWPGIWTLGNLGRPGYMSTTDGVWPYAYDECDAGITPNQSSSDGLSFLPGQKFARCVCTGEDHPSPGIGRGAPEIDVLEASTDGKLRLGIITQSNQIAPFDIWHRPDINFLAIKNPTVTQMNGWSGGPFQQAISGVTTLNNEWYDGKQFQKYAFEYRPGKRNGKIAWFVGDEETFRMTGDAIGPNGNIGQRDISREPMSIVFNLGLSTSWTYIDWNLLGLTDGVTMHIDYIRIYQEQGKESVTCDPPGFPTTGYIKNHLVAYMNPNLTLWKDTGYAWPRNELVPGC